MYMIKKPVAYTISLPIISCICNSVNLQYRFLMKNEPLLEQLKKKICYLGKPQVPAEYAATTLSQQIISFLHSQVLLVD